MKHNIFASIVMTLACSAFLRADTEVEWDRVCAASQGNRLVVTTTTGETEEGFCTMITVNEVGLTTGQRMTKIAKDKISRLRVHRVKGRQLSSLFKEMGHSFRDATGTLFSPLAPVGIVWLPGTVAWGAIASPFCLLADVGGLLAGDYDIKVK
jgi:hypothetical protein